MLTLAQLSGIVIGLMVVGFFFLCVVMILTVLIQKPQGGGLSGAFGSGAGSGQTAFGARTGDALTVATISIFVLYILAAIGLNFAVRPSIAAPTGPEVQPTNQTAPESVPVDAAPGTTPTTPGTTTPTTDPAATTPTTPPTTPPATTPPVPAPTEPAPSVPPANPQTPPATPGNG